MGRMDTPPAVPSLEPMREHIRAAEYVRMSTDHQQYSTANQSAAIRRYASVRGMEIIRTYADEGRSGLTFGRRDALKRLIECVQSGNADFDAILVYDVSRWGRFQDVDESAYYEHVCKRAGVDVHYCAEEFANDGSLASAILKSVKRAMAGEYSRELSIKVFAGQRRVVGHGFRLGGIAGYGLRRVLLDQQGTLKCVLAPGEWKSIATDRVALIPGPSEELCIVREIFSLFVNEKRTEKQIAMALNERGIRNHIGNVWTASTIRYLLQSEKYIGNCLWNRKSTKLRGRTLRNTPESWVRIEGALEPIVDRSLFDAAQAIYRGRPHRTYRGRPRGLTDEEMLDRLAAVFRAHGRLSRRIVDNAEGLPSYWSYAVRFGSIARAYALVGFKQDTNQHGPGIRDRLTIKDPRGLRDEEMLEKLKRVLNERGYLSKRVIDGCTDAPSSHAYQTHFGGLGRAYELIGYSRPYRTRPSSSEREMLEALKQLWVQRGDLSRKIIQQANGLPSPYTYSYRFGGLVAAYKLIGFTSRRPKLLATLRGVTNEAMLEKLKALLDERGYVSSRLIDRTVGMPSRSLYVKRFGSLLRAYQRIGYTPACLARLPQKR